MVEIPDNFKELVEKVEGNIYHVEVSENCRTNYNPCSDYLENSKVDYRHTHLKKKGKNWFTLGKEERWASIMQQLYCDSGIHRSIIDAKVNMIIGGGLEFEVPKFLCTKNTDGIYEREELIFNGESGEREKDALVQEGELWGKNVGLDDYHKKASIEHSIYGGYYGTGRYSLKANTAETFLRKLYVEDFNSMRQSTKRKFIDNKFQSEEHYLSRKWSKGGNRKFYEDFEKYVENIDANHIPTAVIPVDDGSIYKDRNFGIRSKFVAEETPVRKVYSSPDYETRKALNYIMIDYLISVNDFNGISNNFAVEYFVIRYRKRKATETEELSEKEKDIKMMKNHQGVDGKTLGFMWAEPYVDTTGKVQTPPPIQIIEVPRDNSHDRFNLMREERSIAILNAHGVINPAIVGIPNLLKTGLASQAEMLVAALEQFYFNRIRPTQKSIEEDINERLLLDGLPLVVKTKKSLPVFRSFSDNILLSIFGKDELREMVGRGKMTEETKEELAQNLFNKVADTQNNTEGNV